MLLNATNPLPTGCTTVEQALVFLNSVAYAENGYGLIIEGPGRSVLRVQHGIFGLKEQAQERVYMQTTFGMTKPSYALAGKADWLFTAEEIKPGVAMPDVYLSGSFS